jgi:septal ring factor EnvC (AmiA/AmiB activator)
MPKILLGISILFMLGAAGVGFLTKSKIDGLRSEATIAAQRIEAQQQQISKTTEEMNAAKAQASEFEAKAEGLAKDLTAAQDEAKQAQGKIAELQQNIDALTQQVTDLTAKAGSTTAGGVGQTDVAAMETRVKEAETKLAELQQINQSLTQRVDDAEQKSRALQEESDRRQRGLMAKGLEGRVLAVNQGWNFVVLSLGDRQGVVNNAEMIVMRDDTMVGKVRVTSVEPSTSIADIVPGSVPAGVRVQPGDRVIYPGAS